MAKKSNLQRAIEEVSPEEKAKREAEKVAADAKRQKANAGIPDGYEDQSTDVVGFWMPDGDALHFTPMECRLLDSSADKTKSSCLVIGKLVAPSELSTSDGIIVQGEEGDIVGVWAKPGMAPIANLCGVPVYMYLDGHKDVGKASPMAVFAVLSKTRGTVLPVSKDTRVTSRGARDPLGLVIPEASK